MSLMLIMTRDKIVTSPSTTNLCPAFVPSSSIRLTSLTPAANTTVNKNSIQATPTVVDNNSTTQTIPSTLSNFMFKEFISSTVFANLSSNAKPVTVPIPTTASVTDGINEEVDNL